MNIPELSEQEQIRRKSLDDLRKLGIDPYPAAEYKTNVFATEILDNFEPEKNNFQDVCLAGRIMSRRIMGNASFAELMDSSGRIQIYLRRDDICPGEDKTMYNTVFKHLLDIGDIIGVKGYVFKTRMGETTVYVKEFTILCKSIHPLPIVKEKEGILYDAVTDQDMRYRRRYIDLIVNPHVRDVFRKRTQIMQSMREFFNFRGYLEVETPILQPIPGGAAARPFITHHNTLDIPLYLRIANELYLKRLIVGGFEGVYEFSKDFRNEGMDRTHNPEFTVMEIYIAYKDYNWMMTFTEEIIKKTVMDLHGKTEITYNDKIINLDPPYKRISMLDSIRENTGVDITGMDEAELRKVCDRFDIEHDPTMGKGKLIDAIFREKCEHTLVQPTFIIDYPTETSPLTKMHRSKPGLTERFELYINCKEIANAYSELNDPIDQMERFKEQLKLSEKGDDEAMFIDNDFVKALEVGMPPTSGMGLGIDRLTMLLTNQPSIQDVLLFPQMKPLSQKLKVESQKEEYIQHGIPEEWIDPLRKLGYTTISKLKEVGKPGKLYQEMMDYRKKNKLEIKTVTLDQVAKWIKKATEKTEKVFNTQLREHNESWIIKQIKELLLFAKVQKNSSLVLYAALETRNLIEMVEYNIIKTSLPKSEWAELATEAKGKDSLQKADKYNTLKKKYQLFYQYVAENLNVESYAYDLANSIKQKNILANYIHTYILDEKDFEFEGNYIQNGIESIEEALSLLKEFFNCNENEGTYGNLVFKTLPEDYRQALDKWKKNPSEDLKVLEKIFSELNL